MITGTEILKHLSPLSYDTREELIHIYKTETNNRIVTQWRKGASHKRALELLTDYISEEFGHENWKCNIGNFFETFFPYRIHTDTSLKESSYQTIVVPIDWTHEADADLDDNVLYVFEQRWYKEGTMFMKGSPKTNENSRTNTETREYSEVYDIREGYCIDDDIIQDCDHLPKENFEGLTIAKKLKWEPGKPFTFPRTALHCSNNWHNLGIERKLGLSLFTTTD